MGIEKIVSNLLAAWEAHDLTKAANLLANNFKLIGVTPKPLNKDAFVTFQQIHNKAFPDWRFNVSEIEARDNQVYVTFRIKATHTGTFDVSKLGLAIEPILPTGKSRSWPVEYMTCTLKNGKITRIEFDVGPGGGLNGTLEWLAATTPVAAT